MLIYLFMKLFFHARILGVSAALVTFTSQGISVLQSWWHLTNFTARLGRKRINASPPLPRTVLKEIQQEVQSKQFFPLDHQICPHSRQNWYNNL